MVDFSETGSVHDFVETKLGMLLGVMKAYSQLYSQSQTLSRENLVKSLTKSYSNLDAQDAMEALIAFEVKTFF